MDTKTWLKYWRRAVWVTWLLRCIPFVRMVGLNGSMVTGTFRKESDIDLYIVTADGHIFVSRVLVTFLLKLLCVRRTATNIAGKVCDNRFAVESFVDITPHDEYHARVFHNLIPLFDADAVYAKYRTANSWMSALGEPVTAHQPLFGHSVVTFMIQKVGEAILGWSVLESYVEKLQQQRFNQDTRVLMPGSKVIINNRELRFHLQKETHG